MTSVNEASLLNLVEECTKKTYLTKDTVSTASLLFLLNINGKAYSLFDHYMLEPMFNLLLPRRSLWKCARQIGKSQNLCGSRLLLSLAVPHYKILFVCPRFEQVKRLSNTIIKPLVNSSLCKNLFVADEARNSQTVLQREFRNGSTHFYSFAFLDADRVRGVSANEICLDEVQDISHEHLPVIEETLSGDKIWRNQRFTGTPKTLENTIETLWQESSMAEWVIKCNHSGCSHWNVASIEEDLWNMLGEKTLVCAKCRKPINPRGGCWVHRHVSKRTSFAGYHVSQPIHPIHCEAEQNWKELLYKMRIYPKWRFVNECLGESYDSATRLISITDLRKSSVLPFKNSKQKAFEVRKNYKMLVLGIDWGGGGEVSCSYTALALLGATHDGFLDVIYAEKLHRDMTPQEETTYILGLASQFRPQFIAHDYGGAGNLREIMLLQAGYPQRGLFPCTYTFSASKTIIRYNKGTSGNRSSYYIDKPRSLITFCAMFKLGKVRLPEWDDEASACFMDFLSLAEERQERSVGSDVLLIKKIPDKSDDMAHALNFAASCLWKALGSYPNMAEAMNFALSKKDIGDIVPRTPDWD